MTRSGDVPEEAPRVVALLSGRAERDVPIRQALSQADPGHLTAQDPEGTIAAARAAGPALVVVDAARSGLEVAELARALRERDDAAAPLLLVLWPAEALPEEERARGDHWLAGHAPPETLALLIGALLERAAEAPASGEDTPALRLRRPARFSARPLYADTREHARRVLDDAAEDVPPDLDALREASERVHTSLLQSNMLLLRALEPYTWFDLSVHCANVAVIAGKISMGLGRPLSDTLRAIQAGLVHDLGMARLPSRILEKEGPLSDAERAEMERHPALGAELLASAGSDAAWLRRAVLEEHERMEGQGYPEGLAGDAIDPLARLIAVADVFEAYSHVRSYRSPFTLYEALEKVASLRGGALDPACVDALVSEVSVFPVDSYVLLGSGEIARVTAVNPTNLLRPAVEVLWDAEWTPLAEPRRLELAARADVQVLRPLHEAEVPIT